MKTTRELLELAARAAGYIRIADAYDESKGIQMVNWAWWNPATDDGDSARLEAALGLDVMWYEEYVYVGAGPLFEVGVYSDHDGDKQAARRMATLRAAALIGEMK